MLTSDTRYVLKELRQLTENGKYGFLMGPPPDSVYIQVATRHEPVHIKTKIPFELSKQIDFLIDEGYVQVVGHDMELTYKGLHPYKLSFLEIRRFLIKSVFIPIIIALATSLITLLLTGEL